MDKQNSVNPVQSNSTQWIVIGIGILIVVLGVWWLTSRKASAPSTQTATTTTSNSVTSAATPNTKPTAGTMTVTSIPSADTSSSGGISAGANGETVSVDDQLAGSSVTVSANITRPTWVAVKDANGWVLGAARFNTPIKNATIPLLRATNAGINYYVVLFADDGDNMFDIHKDRIIVDPTGNPINRSFNAQ